MQFPIIRNLKLLLLLTDTVILNFIFLALLYFVIPEDLHTTEWSAIKFLLVLNASWFGAVLCCTIYDEKHILSPTALLNSSLRTLLTCFLIISVIVVYFYHNTLSYRSLGIILISIYITLFINHLVTRFACRFFRKKHFDSNRVLILGYNELSVKLAEELEAGTVNKKIIGYCEEKRNVSELSRYPILGNLKTALEMCNHYGITEIYSTVEPSKKNKFVEKLIQSAEQQCIRVRIVPNIGKYLNTHTEVQYLTEMPVISLHKEPLQNINNRFIKRVFDILFSLMVIILINSWLLPLVAILIWIETKGTAIFFQERSGENNAPFFIFKFRSMYVNANSDNIQAVKNDGRITKIGKFLRRTSLDEFPQFFNVLKGDMSIVGPRPHMVKHTDEYSKVIEQYMVRQFVKPGITGLAQVNGFRGETKNIQKMQKRIELDIQYLENWSIQADIQIIFKTIYNILKGEENAY